MVIYNVTIKIEWAIHEAWRNWMLEEHMPEVVATGCFVKCQLLRLLEIDETDGPTFAAQYMAVSLEDYSTYIREHAAGMRKKVTEKWGNQVVAFRSLMEVVH
ncbi:DUF4286 family protein [Flavihumibacter fluvii]|uniref:DUF4286 family protein n=1 Tax=Flavihumibacter fluvii TaxID=2838157 RepID=UPI001BDE2BE8|nr:DUF4286 family protein [Flavihumibacter fluvii]ULQ51349.1 DUF4286 family protein [Flavihumibacter fluvii]